MEEAEIEDKVWTVNPIGEGARIWVIHQAASRYLRRDIAQNMKKNIKELEVVDIEELNTRIEEEAVKIENAFCKLFTDVPVFDFELN